ncbi:unnamed protein product, partial [Prorocentrum cordatum]
MEEPRRRRPNRSAAARRAQYRRAECRTVERLLAAFAELRGHRGGAPTRLGAALAAALAPAASPDVAAEDATGSEAADLGIERESQAERVEGPPDDAPQPTAATGGAAEPSLADMVRALRGELAEVVAESRAEAIAAEQAAEDEKEKESTATDVLRAMQGGRFGSVAVPLGGPAAGAEGAAEGPLRGMTAHPLAAVAGWAGSTTGSQIDS